MNYRSMNTYTVNFNAEDHDVIIDGVPVVAPISLEVYDPDVEGQPFEVDEAFVDGDIVLGTDDEFVELQWQDGGLFYHAEAAIVAWLATSEGREVVGDALINRHEDAWERRYAAR